MADKHTKLNSQFHAVSAFWQPETPDDVKTGTLTINERAIAFTTAPVYSKGIPPGELALLVDRVNKAEVQGMPALQGFTEEGPCTLCHVQEQNRPGLTDFRLDQSITAIAYDARMCVMGMHFGGLHEKCLHSARFTFTGLSEWLPKSTTEEWGADYIILKIPLVEQEILSVCLPANRIQVRLSIFSELNTSDKEGARISKSVAYVEVTSYSPETLSWYASVGNRLENLFSLLTGNSLGLETFFIYRGEESGTVFAKRNEDVKPFDLREVVRLNQSQLATSLSIWLSESEEFQAIENLALGVARRGKLFVETEFLSLAQALEGLHRVTTPFTATDKATLRRARKKISKLLKDDYVNPELSKRISAALQHANDPSLAKRLTQLCGRMSDSLLNQMNLDVVGFVREIVATRNFYTHPGNSLKPQGKTPLSVSELFALNQKMRALLRGILLLHLGVPEIAMADLLIRQATRWD
jgi:hypothetical protein